MDRPQTGCMPNPATISKRIETGAHLPFHGEKIEPAKKVDVSYIKNYLVDKTGRKVDISNLTGPGKYLGILFTARWCDPSCKFVPVVAEFQKRLKAGGKIKDFTIIHVSWDTSKDCFELTLKCTDQDWYGVDFDESDIIDRVGEDMGVLGIPMLYILSSETWEIFTTNGRQDILEDPAGQYFPWKDQDCPWVKNQRVSKFANCPRHDLPAHDRPYPGL